MTTPKLVIGCMTGTSLDGLDIAAVEIAGRSLDLVPTFLRGLTLPLGPLSTTLRHIAEQSLLPAGDIAAASRALSDLHTRAITDLIASLGKRPTLICAHGQTVFHKPPLSWQLLSPAAIAHQTGIPVVSDLRAMDLAAGGQGAPVMPLADWLLYRHLGPRLAIANLGGFCNITLLNDRAADTHGRDICACSQLLDHIARKLLDKPFDTSGQAALSGTPHPDALEDLDGVLRAQAASRRSLGTGDELGDWVSRWRAHLTPADIAATACEAIGQAIADATREHHRLILAGGGVRNAALVRAITSCASCRVDLSDAVGVPSAYREAAGFAVLGALCAEAVPITLPTITGVREAPIAGSWIFPRGPHAFATEWAQ